MLNFLFFITLSLSTASVILPTASNIKNITETDGNLLRVNFSSSQLLHRRSTANGWTPLIYPSRPFPQNVNIQSGTFSQNHPGQSGAFLHNSPNQSGAFSQNFPNQSGTLSQNGPNQSGAFSQNFPNQSGVFSKNPPSQSGAFSNFNSQSGGRSLPFGMSPPLRGVSNFRNMNKMSLNRPMFPRSMNFGPGFKNGPYGPPTVLQPQNNFPPISPPKGKNYEDESRQEENSINGEESELRFLFHRPEDENLIKSTIQAESARYNERVSFIRGPALKFERKQTIYLPPKKRSVIYVLLKEPEVQTDLEIIEPNVEQTPEVNIIYEKGGGVIRKHYYSTNGVPNETKNELKAHGAQNSGVLSNIANSGAQNSQKNNGGGYGVNILNDQISTGSEVSEVTELPLVEILANGTKITTKREVKASDLSPCLGVFMKKLRK